MLYWPRGLVSAGVVTWKLNTPATPAGATLAGQPQTVFSTGGPSWSLSLEQIVGRGREAVLGLRALKTALDAGVAPIVIAPCDCRQVPLASGQSLGAEPDTDGSPFNDFQAGESQPIVASFAAGAALRAATVTLTRTSGARVFAAGDQFSVDNASWGRRMHRIIAVTGGTDNAPQVRIRPLLREAVTLGQAVDFNRPSCVMRLEGGFDIEQVVRFRLSTARARFVELERPIA